MIKKIPSFEPRFFSDHEISSQTVKGQWSKIVKAVLADSPMSREEVARQISQRIGENVTKGYLDACSSYEKDTHTISLPRLMGLLEVTKDERIINHLAQKIDGMIVPRSFEKHLRVAHLKALREEIDREIAESEGCNA